MYLWRTLVGLVIFAAIVTGIYFLFPGVVVNADKDFELWRAGLRVHQVNVASHRIQFLDSGGQGRPLLMLHGFGADYFSWPRMVRHLGDGYRVIAPDLPGFGKSSRIETASYDISHQADRMRGFLDALGIHRVDIIGNSMGGWIAAAFAARYPDRVRTLTLIDTGGITAPHPSPFMQAVKQGKNPLIAHNREQFNKLLKLVFYHQPFIPGPLKGYFAREAVKHASFNEKVFKDLTTHYLALEPLLPKLRMPTLVMWGRHDKVLDPSSVQVLQAGLPDATVHWFDTGHVPMLEQPRATAKVLTAFLNRHPG